MKSENANRFKGEEIKLEKKNTISIGRLSSFLVTGTNEEFTANIT